MTDPYGRGDYPLHDRDAAWQRFRTELSCQHSRVLAALRRTAAEEVEDAEEGECETCDGAALVIAELVKLLDTELHERHHHLIATIDALALGEGEE